MTRLVEVQRNLAGGKPTIVVPGRQLVREGTLMKMSMKGGNKKASAVYMVLLSDMILYCKEWKVSEKLRCERVLPISKCSVNKLMFKQGLFNLRCQSVSYILYSPTTSEEGNEWYNAIKRTIEEHQAKFQTLRKKYSSRNALKRKDLDKLNDAVTLKPKRKRKASSGEDGDTSADCGFHSPWKVLKLSSTLIPTASSRSTRDNQHSGPATSQGGKENHPSSSETTPTHGSGKETSPATNMSYENAVASGNEKPRASGSFTHTLMVQAKTVVTMLGESMKRYLLPSSNSAR
ncbi:hypothetical protein WDU94_001066 [Cyamophila willieti]